MLDTNPLYLNPLIIQTPFCKSITIFDGIVMCSKSERDHFPIENNSYSYLNNPRSQAREGQLK